MSFSEGCTEEVETYIENFSGKFIILKSILVFLLYSPLGLGGAADECEELQCESKIFVAFDSCMKGPLNKGGSKRSKRWIILNRLGKYVIPT